MHFFPRYSFLRFLPRYSFLRFLSPVAVFLFSAVVGVSFAAWLDAPNAPPNYGIVGCTPPCSQEDFKPMNLGTTPQIKRSGATFEGDLTARKFFDYDNSAYFIDPASGVEAGNLSGKLTVGGEVHANGFYDAQDTGYYLDPAAASGFSGKFAGKVGVRQKSPTASLAVNNYYDPSDPGHVKETSGKAGSLGDALYAYTNSTNAAVSAEQANPAGYAIYASGGINYFGGNVGIRTTDTETYALNVLGNANATQLCIAGDCKSVWPTAPAETDPKVSGGSSNYLTKWTSATTLGTSAIYDNGNIGIGTANPTLAKLNVQGIAAGGSIGIYTTGSTYGFYTADKVRAGGLCVGSDSECINSLVPRAYADGNGAWTWTQVVNNTIPNGYSMVWRQGSVSLDSTRPVFGLRISGSSDDGAACGAGVGGYFWGWVGRFASFTGYTYDVFGSTSGVLLGSGGAGSFGTGEWIFENTPMGKNGGGPVANKAAGVIFIPPGKTLYYWQIYRDSSNTCIVEVLYGN